MSEKTATEGAAESLATETVDKLADKLASVDVTEDMDPTLLAGDLLVRQAGKESGTDVAYADSFSNLPMRKELKDAVAKKGWQKMSKIQQIGLPLFMHNPPANLLAQAQAGTGKTGTFVLGLLARLDDKLLAVDKMKRLNRPQGIILANTQELVTQIAHIVDEFGASIGVKVRRIMSAGMHPDAGGGRGGRGRGRGGGPPGGPAGRGGGPSGGAKPEWALSEGESFEEQVLVGTVGKMKQFLQNHRNGKTPCIDASDVCVVVLDEADELLRTDDVFDVRDMIVAKRGMDKVQFALFSATYRDNMLDRARVFVGNDRKRYHEVTLRKEDLTLDKVDNFFILVGKQGDHDTAVFDLKCEAVLDIWKSLADSTLKGQTVIFVNEKSRVQPLAKYLADSELKPSVAQIHGDMEKLDRERVFQEFKDNKWSALVATNLLSRGIDNPNVTLVINFDLPIDTRAGGGAGGGFKSGGGPPPGDAETFIHRIGRSGRWTNRGASVSLVSMRDKPIMAEIERKLFVDVDRPLILVHEAAQLGDALKRRTEERKAQKAAATAATSSS